MSIQVYSRRWKPQRWNVGLERVAPDCRWSWSGLVLAWPLWDTGFASGATGFTERVKLQDPVRRTWHAYPVGAATNGVEFVGGCRGVVAKVGHTGGPGRISTRNTDMSFLPTGPCTVILPYRKLDTTNRASGAFGVVTFESGAKLFGAHLPYSDGNVYWDYGGFSGNNRLTIASGSGIDFTADNVWAFTNGPRGMEIWLNGVRKANNAVEVTRTQATSASNGWGLFQNANATCDLAEGGGILLYSRQLSEAELRMLMIDPWTPFRPWRKVRAKTTAAAAGVGRSFVPAIIG